MSLPHRREKKMNCVSSLHCDYGLCCVILSFSLSEYQFDQHLISSPVLYIIPVSQAVWRDCHRRIDSLELFIVTNFPKKTFPNFQLRQFPSFHPIEELIPTSECACTSKTSAEEPHLLLHSPQECTWSSGRLEKDGGLDLFESLLEVTLWIEHLSLASCVSGFSTICSFCSFAHHYAVGPNIVLLWPTVE